MVGSTFSGRWRSVAVIGVSSGQMVLNIGLPVVSVTSARELAALLVHELAMNAGGIGTTFSDADRILRHIRDAGVLAQSALMHDTVILEDPEDVAACLVTLSQPGTAWLTGNVLRVDGGESVSG